MNKIYDKLLLVVAVLLLAGGVFLYLQKSGQTPSLSAPVDVTTADNPYAPETVPSSESTEANWPETDVQSTGWRYDVFTPPKIYIDEEGNFTEEGWEPPVPPAPFGVYLAEITRKPYRIQFEGYIEEDRSDVSKTLLLMYNEETQRQVRARPGDTKPAAEFEVVDFDIQRIRGGGGIEVVAQATILDQRSGEEVVLVHGERRYDSGVTVLIRSREYPSYEMVLTQAPAEFEGPEATGANYTLLEINLEESSVTVEKQGTEEEESETRTLSVGSAKPSPAPNPSPPAETNPVEGNDAFDLMFQ